METRIDGWRGWKRPGGHALAFAMILTGWIVPARGDDGPKPAPPAAPAAASKGAPTNPPAEQKPDPSAAKASAEAPPAAEPSDDLSVLLSRYQVGTDSTPGATAGAKNPASGTFDGSISRTGCATCGGHGPLYGTGGCSSCGTKRCVPGRNCSLPDPDSFSGRLFGNLYECLCCPDPCYQPAWIPEANASFFTDFARPRTVTRLRYDHGFNLIFPDRNEYFWQRENLNTSKLFTARNIALSNLNPARTGFGGGQGPAIPAGTRFKMFAPRGVIGETAVNYDQLYLYQEAASERGSLFIEMPYRNLSPHIAAHQAGFGDLNFGTKALLVDCEMLQLTFQFKTYTPTGIASKGLGTGHVSLEPSFLLAVRLAESTYFQAQLAEWIPLGGTQGYAGALLKYSFSLNHTLFRTAPDSPVIGTFEMMGMSFQNGLYTNPYTGPQQSSGTTYFSVGPGIRHSVCDRIDYGGAVVWPVNGGGNFGNPILRLEMRVFF